MITPNSDIATLFTIGHSTHEWPAFLALLRQHDISAIGDVRSHPYSRFNPQYNRETLQDALHQERIQYAFLGTELGARRKERECYEGKKALYERIAQTPAFAAGLTRVRKAVTQHRVALMCSEKDPLTCHRTILICRALRNDAFQIQHILEDGTIETMAAAEGRLLNLLGLPPGDLFRSRAEVLDEAYERQGDRIAYSESEQDEATLR